jgi:hypothetical protein
MTPGYACDVQKPTGNRLPEAEARERDERLDAAGIEVENPPPGTSTITLEKRATREQDLLTDDDDSGTVE